MTEHTEGTPGTASAVQAEAPRLRDAEVIATPNATGVIADKRAADLAEFSAGCYEPIDIVELRCVRRSDGDVKQRWCLASELASRESVAWMTALNDTGYDIWAGANPRKAKGGAKAEDVALARSLHVDHDNQSVDDALKKIDAAGMPRPTSIVDTGHGCQSRWRFAEAITDLAIWTERQKDLAALVASDPKVNDAPHVLRIPGFTNHKAPVATSSLVECDASRVYEWSEIFPLIPRRAARGVAGGNGDGQPADPVGGHISEGRRNATLTSLGGSMRRRGMNVDSITAALLAENAAKCRPPLDEDEVRGIARSVCRYEPAPNLPIVATATRWPDAPDDAVYHGLVGEIVRKIEPHSEADPISLLIHLLISFGNIIGRTAHFEADGAKHYANLFAVTVGETSKGRKGTAQRQVDRLCRSIAPDWCDTRVVEGLSSGEGLIWAVRDIVKQRQPVRQKGRVVDYEEVEIDPGVTDKRLFVVESEFAGTLKVAQRETNTLSPVVRRAWDTGMLRTLTKNSPATATNAHISIIGHITRDELRRNLDSTETANGFCNRYLWVCVRRSKCLPEGGQSHTVDWSSEVRRLSEAIEAGKGATLIIRDPKARELWARVYPELSAGHPGLLGAVTSRAEAQVMRLAMVYALLDNVRLVRVEHLRAALALWSYCEASAAYIFGSSLGDRMADELLQALRDAQDGLSRKQITVEVFGKHRSAEAIGRALATLVQAGLTRRESRADTGGRPEERWFVTTPLANKANEANKASGDSSQSSLHSPQVMDEAEWERQEREAIQSDGAGTGGATHE